MPVQKKSGNLLNAPRMIVLGSVWDIIEKDQEQYGTSNVNGNM